MMTRRNTGQTITLRLLRDSCLATLLCLTAATAYATQHFIDMQTCTDIVPLPVDYVTIPATTGMIVNDTIEVQNATGNVSYLFDDSPGVCSPTATSFTCNGVNVTLPSPGSQPNPIPVTGTAGSGGSFSFVVEASDTNKSCLAGFEIAITQPFDLVFVIDRSGSMGWDADPNKPGLTRWQALKDGVLGNMMTAGLTAEVVSGEPASGSRFGLTLFSTDIVPNNSFSSALVDITGGLPNAVSEELSSQNPGGWTNLGKGLKAGEAKMSDCLRPRVAVVFTDGEQNQPPEVSGDGTSYDDSSPVNATCPGVNQQAVEVVSVSMIQTCAACLTMLQNLANNNGGNQMIITTNGLDYFMDDGVTVVGDIADAYNFAIAPALQGNSPQLVAVTMEGLSGTVVLPAFDVNELVDNILVQVRLTQSLGHSKLPGIRVEKDGTDVTEFFQLATVNGAPSVFTIHTNFEHPDSDSGTSLEAPGSYTVELTAPERAPPDLGFVATTYVNDHRFEIDWHVTPTSPRVGEAFDPTVALSWRGDPVENATVDAWILQPRVALGDLLANDPTTVDPSSAQDAGSPGEQKLQHLLNNDPNFLAKIKASELQHTLSHQGNGVYSVSFNPGEISGVYHVVYRVRADDPAFGKIQRIAAQSVYTRFGDIDFPSSILGGAVVGNVTTLDLRPITTYGRFVGPGNAKAVQVGGVGNTLTSISDDQDGSYTMVIEGDPSAVITISILNEPIFEGPAEEAVPAGSGGGLIDRIKNILKGLGLPEWLVWILLLLILFLIIWLLRKIFGGSP